MRVTIIKDDNMVRVDGVSMRVDCSKADFHAVQWYGGDVERIVDGQNTNEAIDDFALIKPYVDAHAAAVAQAKAEAAARESAARAPETPSQSGAVSVIAP